MQVLTYIAKLLKKSIKKLKILFKIKLWDIVPQHHTRLNHAHHNC